jgi:hypothetical protein
VKHSIFLIKKLFIIFIVGFSFENQADQTPKKGLISHEQWQFLEQHFIIKPQQVSSSFISTLKKNISSLIVAGITAAITYYALHSFVPEKIAYKNLSLRTMATLLVTPLLALWAGIIMHRYASYLIQTDIECHSVEAFLQHWPENKELAPESLRTYVGNLHLKYVNNSLSLAQKLDLYTHIISKIDTYKNANLKE